MVPGALAPSLLGGQHRIAPVISLLLATGLWLGSYAIDLLVSDFGGSAWLYRMSCLGMTALAPALLWTALEATGSNRLTRKVRSGLLRIPAVTIALALTSADQRLLYFARTQSELGPLSAISIEPGPWFWVQAAFSCASGLVALAVLARQEVERELQVAIAEQQFRLVFQPRVDLATGQPATLEALIRRKSPVLGTVPPSHFIPIAEKTGQIVPIGSSWR